MTDDLGLLLLVALAALVVGAVLGALVLGTRRGRGSDVPSLTPEALRPLLDELTRGAVNEALGTSGTRLAEQLRQATEDRLRTQQEAAEAQARSAQEVLQRIVEPLSRGVERLDTQVRQLEQARADAYGRLDAQVTATASTLEQLQAATGRLDSAMRSNQVRGQWGELQLQRIVELVGLKEHVSYQQQVQQAGAGSGRPDMTVHLTDGKVLYVDAKAPMAAFLRALEEDDRTRQREHLAQHAKDLLGHVRAISERGYLDDGASIDLLALFVPNEAALAAALEADPELLSRALALRVVVTGPTSLAMMLTNVSASWRQQNVAENAARIVGEVLELHKRLGTFDDHLAKVGQHLSRSVVAYNTAVGSFEHRLLPAARRVETLAAVADDGRIVDLVELDTLPSASLAELARPTGETSDTASDTQDTQDTMSGE
jgi:DNA recombination protein RmuC